MNSRAGFDTGPLSWVKGEIDASMARALSALRAYAADSSHGADITLARSQLHQAHGALSIVGLDGVTRVAEELEALLADLERDAPLRTPAMFALAARAFEALVSYLEVLVSGSDHQALRLYPIYGELVQARGNGPADPVDLYFPDLSFRPPHREKSPVALRAEDEPRYFHDQRARFQRGMLKWLRQDPLGAGEMRAAVEAIEAAQASAGQRSFWWVALAFFDALERNALSPEIDAKRICSRIEQQIRRRLDGSQNIAERLLREVMYGVAQARPESGHLRLVQETCGLRQALPADESAALIPAAGPATPKAAREAIAQAKDTWNQFASGKAQSLPAFQTAAAALKDLSAELGNADLTALAHEIAELASWLVSNPTSMSEAIALELATALLLLENALGDRAAPGAEFAEQSRFVCGRIQACVQGKLLRTAPPIPLLDEMSRKAQERLVMNQLVAEMQANLGRIEQVLDAFFRDSSRRADLAALERPVHQVAGALQMLGEARARAALEDCHAQIRRIAQPEYLPRQDDFERIAQILSGLGFYIEALARGQADFDEAMRPIAPGGLAKAPAASDQAMTVEAELRQQKRETEKLYDQWKKKPTDTWLKGELQKNVIAIRKDAGLIADAALEHKAQEALHALENEQAVPLAPTIAEAIQKIAPASAAHAPSAQTTRLIGASAETVDAEMLAVYLEEADEVLATIGDKLDAVGANPDDREALAVIRRGFHTLKGSGRMVGLTRLGEAAWAVEKTLNPWLEQRRAVNGDVLLLIGAAREYFSANIARLKSGDVVTDESGLLEQAQRIASGKPLAGTVPGTAGTPGEQALSQQTELVSVGEHRVSRAVFEAFSSEAKGLLATLAAEREILLTHSVITDAMMRATHTLAGICGTVGAEAACELGRALERALQALGAMTLSESEASLVGQAIDALGEMVSTIEALQRPTPRADLTDLLGRVGPAPDPTPAMQAASPREPVWTDQEPVRASQSDRPSASAVVALETHERRPRRLDDDLAPQLLPVFLEEASESVTAIGANLREWRANPRESALGQGLQRLLHTLKGSARMAGAMALGELTHHMETRVENALALPSPSVPWFEAMEAWVDRMSHLHQRLARSPAQRALPRDSQPRAGGGEEPLPRAAPVAQHEEQALPATLRVRADAVDRLVNEAGEVAIARGRIECEMRGLRTAVQELTGNVMRLRSQLREIEIQAESQMQSHLKDSQSAGHEFDPLELDRFTRFQELSRLMAESVADVQSVNQNLADAVGRTEAALAAQARLNRDLQHGLMRARMVPFSSLAERLHRIVRQTAKESGRRANLDIRGAQVELDRSVLERMTPAFEHLIRNAIVHGIEPSAERLAKGKSETGEVAIEIAQEGNEVAFTLADDGRGLDMPRIREAALAKGLLAEGVELLEADMADFIFLPGFTTAAEVTRVAGRGVGMDVVRTEVASLGGRVELGFERDRGTRVTIHLPLTLAVTQALLVKAGLRTYAIPAAMVEQVMLFKAEQLAAVHAAGNCEWQARSYRFCSLGRLLEAPQAPAEPKRNNPVLILRSGNNAMALHVDELVGGNEEIVVKPIGPQLQRLAGVSGATVLGSGEIVLIINPVQLALREPRIVAPEVAGVPAEATAPARPTVMIVDDSLTARKVTGRILARAGYEVLLAKDGVEAIEKLRECVPELMLVDIEMPRMDGFDLTRNVRADSRLGQVPIIIITSRTADKHRNYARDIGANVVLGKPFQEQELLGHISGLLLARTRL